MFSEKHYQQLKWIIARNELANYRRQGSYEYQKPKSDSLIDLHERVSGLHLGLRAPQTDQMIDWLEGIDINLFKANKLDFEFDLSKLPDIGLRLEEYQTMPLSSTVNTALEFIHKHKSRNPIIFKNDYWYFQDIIHNHVSNVDEIKKDHLLIISLPFFDNFQKRQDMDLIFERCNDLGVPVMLDLIWLPLIHEKIKVCNTECVEVITHSMTKTIPIAGTKGGVCFWKKPIDKRQSLYCLGNSVGFYLTKKYLEDFHYYYVRDSLVGLQDKWCEILGITSHNLVIAAQIPQGHFLQDQALSSNKMHKMFDSQLFSLIPYYENDVVLTQYLKDQNIV